MSEQEAPPSRVPTTTVSQTREILKRRFTDLHESCGTQGVYVALQPLDANDGFSGDVVLCLEIPIDVFTGHEEFENDPTDPTLTRSVRTDRALLPAGILNRYGPAQIYNHDYAGTSRRELVQAIRFWEEADGPSSAPDMQAAIEFLDEIGWLTLIKVQEELQREKKAREANSGDGPK